jgi:hypothetical protein
MPTLPDRWALFNIRIQNDPSAPDARRVVFEFRNSKSHPATVVVRAGGEMVVRYLPPDPDVPGFNRNDFIMKAVAMVQRMDGAPRPHNPD